MTMTGLSAIDHTVHLTNEWLIDIGNKLDWEDRQRIYRLLRVVLQSLRDWLSVDEAANLAAQLPLLIRGIYYEGWHPAGTPVKKRSKAEFIARIEKAFESDPIDNVEEAVGAVFQTLSDHISQGEAEDVRRSLRKGLRDIWPDVEAIWPELGKKSSPQPGL